MKQVFAIIIISFLLMSCAAQSRGHATIYGFVQGVLPGNPPSHIIDETGKVINPRIRPKFNYLVYVVSSKEITPTELWIRGIAYKVQVLSIKETPVTFENTNVPVNPQTQILVPQTDSFVYKLSQGEILENKNESKISTQAKNNDIIIVYRQNNKNYYSILKKLKPMEPVATQ